MTDSPNYRPLTQSNRKTTTLVREKLIEMSLAACAILSIFVTIGIIVVLLNESVFAVFGESARAKARAAEAAATKAHDADETQTVDEHTAGVHHDRFGAFFEVVSLGEFFGETEWTPTYTGDSQHFGVLPLVVGTGLITIIAAAVGLPIGLMSAVYLSEYASPKTRGIVKPILEILAGIPTVVYGFFALVFVTPYLLDPLFEGTMGLEVERFNALSAGLVVGIMIIPMVSSLSEDALRAVPRSLREAGYSLGATKFQVSTSIVVPAATSGIVASFLLAIARAIGETMAVAMAAGSYANTSLNPLEAHQAMTGFIASISGTDSVVGTIQYNSLYAVALLLFVTTLALNVISFFVTRRFREVYQ